jgi:hypothetical protein
LLPDVLSDAKANCQKIAENGTVKGAPKIVQKCQSVSRTVQGPSNGTSQKTSKTAEKSGDLSLNGINCPDVSKTGELGFEPNENLIFTLKTMIFS